MTTDYKKEESFHKMQMVITRFCKLANNSNLDINTFSIKELVKPDLFEKDCESKVYEFIKELELLYLANDWDYLKLLKLFDSRARDLEEFFDKEKGVLVMTDNIELKNNRLNLISIIRNYSLLIADFTLL